MANKASGGSRYVLIIMRGDEIRAVTASESNSKAEYRRLKKKAKSLVQSDDWQLPHDSLRLYAVIEPEQWSQASVITDLEIKEWINERPEKEEKKAADKKEE